MSGIDAGVDHGHDHVRAGGVVCRMRLVRQDQLISGLSHIARARPWCRSS